MPLYPGRFDSCVGQTDLKSVVKKIACDEAVFAPQLAVSYLAASAYIQNPGDWGAVGENVQSKVCGGTSYRCCGRGFRSCLHASTTEVVFGALT